MAAKRIAVIGFGFSGFMVVANLVKRAAEGTILYIIGEDLNARGLAYSTTNTDHLLNVPAIKMGAFPEAIDGLFAWLKTADAAIAKQQLGLTKNYAEIDFIPRALYAAYLQSIWQETQEIAAQHKVQLKLVETSATAIQHGAELAVLTARGDAISVDDIVLATGNETKPVLIHLPVSHVIQNPWAPGVFADAASWKSPVILMGVGLTAVDTILSLRSHGYEGEIIAFSRNGLLPQPHAAASRIFACDKDALFAQFSLIKLLRFIRQAIAEQEGDWRVVIDALRPYTQALWQKMSPRDQKRFLTRLLTIWNTHRHRMAPEIAAAIHAEIAAGTMRIVATKTMKSELIEGVLTVTLNGEVIQPAHIINCTGPQLNVAKSSATLLIQALADGIVEPHANGLGIAADPQLRAWGSAYPHIYAIGGLLTGQLMESTAVPELRTQAAQIAARLID